MDRWAVFDVDGTLLPNTSMEKMFILYLIKKNFLPAENILYYFLRVLLLSIHENIIEAFKNNKYYLKNLPIEKIEPLGKKFTRTNILPKISKIGLKKIEKYRNNGFNILIMSGSPDFLVQSLEHFIQYHALIATELEKRGNYFTGRVKGLHPYGKRKSILIKKFSHIWKISLHDSIVFANHHSDADHMELFGQAVVVNPTKKLIPIAKKYHWPIEWWR